MSEAWILATQDVAFVGWTLFVYSVGVFFGSRARKAP